MGSGHRARRRHHWSRQISELVSNVIIEKCNENLNLFQVHVQADLSL